MLLTEFFDHVYLPNHPFGIAASTERQIRAAIGTFQRIIGREVNINDISQSNVNQMLDWLRINRKPDTFRTVRGAILTLWRSAIDEGYNTNPIDKIRKFRSPKRKPVAFTPHEVQKILDTFCPAGLSHEELSSRRLPNINLPSAYYWDSIIRVAYDTALRLGDLLSLRPEQIEYVGDSGKVTTVVSKTGETVTRWLYPETCVSVRRIMSVETDRELIWPLWGRRCAFYRRFRKAVKEAGIRQGTFRYVRRCAVTWAEVQQEGQGTTLAGHSSRRVTLESYRDIEQIDLRRVAPPKLTEAVQQWESRLALR